MNRDQLNSHFPLLNQKGPFSTLDNSPEHRHLSQSSRQWVRKLNNAMVAAKYRAMRNQIFEILGVNSFAQIQNIIKDKARKESVSQRAYMLLGNMFGIKGTEREIRSIINGYSHTADGVVIYLKRSILSDYALDIEMTNEIESINNPVDLLLLIFNNRYHKKARFEAKRKLMLMNLAGSIDLKERETDIKNKFTQFLNFLNDYVWSPNKKIGQLEKVYLFSKHDEKKFTCMFHRILNEETGRKMDLKSGEKLTVLKRRSFNVDEREIPIYVTIRKKSPEAKVLKLLRKGQENPAVAVDDELGLMGVLNSINDVKAFQRHLTESATKAKTFMTLEEISDTLRGGLYATNNVGSSPNVRMYKFFARMGGMRVEFIIHTNETYLDYMYQREISHDEYEVRRILDSGVAELLFPDEIYRVNFKEVQEELIHKIRKRIEQP